MISALDNIARALRPGASLTVSCQGVGYYAVQVTDRGMVEAGMAAPTVDEAAEMVVERLRERGWSVA